MISSGWWDVSAGMPTTIRQGNWWSSLIVAGAGWVDFSLLQQQRRSACSVPCGDDTASSAPPPPWSNSPASATDPRRCSRRSRAGDSGLCSQRYLRATEAFPDPLPRPDSPSDARRSAAVVQA